MRRRAQARGADVRPVAVGFVGTGAIAAVHREALRAVPGARLVGVVDCDEARAHAFAADEPDAAQRPAALPDLAALAAAGARVVHVLTPPQAHAPVALAALAHGCDVFVEKPLATGEDECAALEAAAARGARRVGVGHSLLADPQIARVLATLAAGRVGAVVGADFFCSASHPEWPGGPLPWHYRDGGNPFRDLGVHGLYLLRACLGEIESVEPAFTSSGHPSLCFDEWHVLVRCARGLGRIRLSWNAQPLQTTFVVQATGGTLRADVGCMFSSLRRPTPLPHAVDRAVGTVQDAWPALAAVPANGARWLAGRVRSYEGVRRTIAAFYRALAEGEPLPASIADGRAVVRWVEAVARAADDAKRARSRRRRAPAPASVLVTGASGRLGARVVAALADDGLRVRAFCRRPPADGPLRRAGVEIVQGDLGDADAVDAAVAGARAVVHAGAAMAGAWPEHARGTIAGTRHVLASARRHGVASLVHVSSLSVLAWAALDGCTVTEDAPLEPQAALRGAYTQAKLEAERLVCEEAAAGFPALVLRPGVLVGPAGPEPGEIGAFLLGRGLVLLATPRARPPLVALDDVVWAIRRALVAPPPPGSVVHLVGAQEETARELARRLASRRGLRMHRLPPAFVRAAAAGGAAVAHLLGRAAPLPPHRLRAATAELRFDCRRARHLLGWFPGVAASGAGVGTALLPPAPARADERGPAPRRAASAGGAP